MLQAGACIIRKNLSNVPYVAVSDTADAFLRDYKDGAYKIDVPDEVYDALLEHIESFVRDNILSPEDGEAAKTLISQHDFGILSACYTYSFDDDALRTYFKYKLGNSVDDRAQSKLMRAREKNMSIHNFFLERKEIMDELAASIRSSRDATITSKYSTVANTGAGKDIQSRGAPIVDSAGREGDGRKDKEEGKKGSDDKRKMKDKRPRWMILYEDAMMRQQQTEDDKSLTSHFFGYEWKSNKNLNIRFFFWRL